MSTPFISIISPCYNEEANLRELWQRITRVMAEALPAYSYEIIFIDNASNDQTLDVLRKICAQDRRVKVIVNNRNFGHIRSPYHAMLQARGDAVISIASDLEDPPELIPQFIARWMEGYKVVLAQKRSSAESAFFWLVRKAYYRFVNRLSDTELVKDVTGFGLYDRETIDGLRAIGDPYPYLRGLICDLGYRRCLVPFDKPLRKRGFTKNNFYTLYDMAMLGITNHSKVPLRIATFTGFICSLLSMMAGFGYLVYKLLYWNRFSAGTAPVIIGLFFFGSLQLFFMGIIGEYVGAIHTQVHRRPLVVESERINFDLGPDDAAVPARPTRRETVHR